MFKFFVLFVFVGCLLISCNDFINSDKNIVETPVKYSVTKQDQVNDVLMPLKVGNYWVYDNLIFDTLGNSKDIMRDTISVDKMETYGVENWYFLYGHWGQEASDSQDPYIVSNTDIGLWCMVFGTRPLQNALEAKYPVTNNSTFSSNQKVQIIFKDSSGIDLAYTIEGTRHITVSYYEKVTVAAGDFDCYKFTEYYDNFNFLNHTPVTAFQISKIIEYFALNIGKIKTEMYLVNYVNGAIVSEKLIVKSELFNCKLF